MIELEQHNAFPGGANDNYAIAVSMIDGTGIYYDGSGYRASNGNWSSAGPPMSLELLPGRHTITFIPWGGEGSMVSRLPKMSM